MDFRTPRLFYIPLLCSLLSTFLTVEGRTAVPTLDSNLQKHFLQIELSIKQMNNSSEIRRAISNLAEEYLSHQLYQEAIWILRSGGLFPEAEQVERRLLSILEREPLILVHDYGIGSRERAVIFRHGNTDVYSVGKNNAQAFENEILFYRFDHDMGFDQVAMTIERRLPTGKVTSLQYFVRGAKEGGELVGLAASLHTIGYPSSFKNMWLLDFLFDNRDRHSRNWLMLYGLRGRIIAIDHGLAFGLSTLKTSVLDLQEKYVPGPPVLQMLKNRTVQYLVQKLRFPQYKAEFVFGKITELLTFAERKSPMSCRRAAGG